MELVWEFIGFLKYILTFLLYGGILCGKIGNADSGPTKVPPHYLQTKRIYLQ